MLIARALNKETTVNVVCFGFVIIRERPETEQWGNLGPRAIVFQGKVLEIQKAAEMLLREEAWEGVNYLGTPKQQFKL